MVVITPKFSTRLPLNVFAEIQLRRTNYRMAPLCQTTVVKRNFYTIHKERDWASPTNVICYSVYIKSSRKCRGLRSSQYLLLQMRSIQWSKKCLVIMHLAQTDSMGVFSNLAGISLRRTFIGCAFIFMKAIWTYRVLTLDILRSYQKFNRQS